MMIIKVVGLASIDGELVKSCTAGLRKEITGLNPLQRLKDSLKGPDWCGLGIAQQSKRSLFRFPLRAHAWVKVRSQVRAFMEAN